MLPARLANRLARRAILTIALGGTAALPAAAQLVSVAEGPLRPYAGPGEQPSARGIDPTPFLRFYASAALTASGGLADGGVGAGPSANAFQFPAVRLTLSVTPRMLAGDSSARDERARMGELLRLNAHIKVQALDASGKAMPDVKGLPGVQTLALSPGDPTMAAPVASNTASEVKATADLIESSLGAAGRIISAFESAFHRSPRPTEVPYQPAMSSAGRGLPRRMRRSKGCTTPLRCCRCRWTRNRCSSPSRW